MKLYFSPGACSLSPHIVLRESGLPFEAIRVDTKTHKLTATGADFYAVNPKGYVPVLELDDGQRLTEGPVIVQYLADRAPQAKLAPALGTIERYRVMEWLNFITAEVHKAFSPLFGQGSDEIKNDARQRVIKRLGWVDSQLANSDYLTGSTFTVADAYLFTVANWTRFTGIDMAPWPHLSAFMARVAQRPAVQEALKAEGLVK